MNRSIIRSILVAVLLLVAQFGASAHALSHAAHQHDDGIPVDTCIWCPAYTNLFGPGADAAFTDPVAPPPAGLVAFEPAPLCPLPLRLAYRSQAPPRRS